jgi:CRISPR-associated protein Cst1
MAAVSAHEASAPGTLAAAAPLRLTAHPLQRCGARAAAALAGVSVPEDVTPPVLDDVAGRLTSDIVRAAVAPNTAVAYDWWKVLFALYPNSPATHSKRSKIPGELTLPVERLFAPDPRDCPVSACVFCGQPAGTVWAKDKLPMFDSMKAVNTLPPGLPGWPACRGCRIAMWALPYGAWVTAGSATVLTCADDAVERHFVYRNTRRARQIQHLGFTSLPALAAAETVTLAALREHAATRSTAVGATLWVFQNNNRAQDAFVRATATRGGVPHFLRRLFADPQPRRGWGILQRVLTQRDNNGQITASGAEAAAKTLFNPADMPGGPPPDRLQRELLRLTRDPDKFTGRTLTAWQALCRLHLEVVHGMDTGQLKPASELVVEWILAERNPRGRFNRYVKAAASPRELQKLLMEASARLMLDGGHPPDVTTAALQLLAPDINAWRLRGQLYFDVIATLVVREAPIGRKPEPGEATDPDDLEDDDLSRSFDPPSSDNDPEERN